MDRVTRAFIVASLIYLSAGGLLGLLMGVSPALLGHLLFPHVHLLLAGFMAMMVFGVGYFILPRFAGTALRWPSLVGYHFWLANVSLLALVVARPLEAATGNAEWTGIFHLAALVQVASFLLFSLNVGATLLARPRQAGSRDEAPVEPRAREPRLSSLPVVGRDAPPPLGPDTPVREFLDRKEGARELLVAAGLRPLQDPQHLEMVRKAGVTLGHACAKHGIPFEELFRQLRALPDRKPAGGGARLNADDVIGQLVERHPAAREVFRRRFGEGCFTCPGFATETLAQGAMMHGVEVNDLIAELQRVVDRREG